MVKRKKDTELNLPYRKCQNENEIYNRQRHTHHYSEARQSLSQVELIPPIRYSYSFLHNFLILSIIFTATMSLSDRFPLWARTLRFRVIRRFPSALLLLTHTLTLQHDIHRGVIPSANHILWKKLYWIIFLCWWGDISAFAAVVWHQKMMMMMWKMFHYIHTENHPQQSSPQKPTSKFIDRNLHCSRALDGNAPTEIIFESSEWVSMENFPMVFRLKWNHGVRCFGREWERDAVHISSS